MALFKKATNTSAKLKMGVMGFAGSGKSYTAALMAIGMVNIMREGNIAGHDKPVFMLDTEGGNSWLKPMFDAQGIEFHTATTAAFADMVNAIPEASREASVLIADSISTVWIEFCETYKQVKNRQRGLEFQDWDYLKTEWRRKFVVPYLNSPVHFILCGRAGFTYDHFTDEAGKKQIEKTGIKMKSEAETGYEPSLVVLMERDTDLRTKEVKHIGHVLKDRRTDAQTLDGKTFENPKFADFLPHIECLNLEGDQMALDATRTSAGIIAADERRDQTRQSCKIICEEISALLAMHNLAGTAGETVSRRMQTLRAHFGTTSKTEIEERMPLHELREKFNKLHWTLEGKPSRYFPGEAEGELDDEILALRQPAPEPAPEASTDAPKAKAGKKGKQKMATKGDIVDALSAASTVEGDGARRIAAINAVYAEHEAAIKMLTTPEQSAVRALKSQLMGRAAQPA